MTVEQPPHPVHALTTYELKNYRRELEHSLRALPEHVAVRVLLSSAWRKCWPSRIPGVGCMRPMDRPNCSGSKDSLAMPIEIFARRGLAPSGRSAFAQRRSAGRDRAPHHRPVAGT